MNEPKLFGFMKVVGSLLLSRQNNNDIDIMGFLAQVHAPTVTMPRIKALTTGSIPGFVDVLLNFGSKELGMQV